MPSYTRGDMISDLIAGITVGLTVVPQSMAYAAIAGLSPEVKLS
jgi:MFS superfamily sulfate permease-like transporter